MPKKIKEAEEEKQKNSGVDARLLLKLSSQLASGCSGVQSPVGILSCLANHEIAGSMRQNVVLLTHFYDLFYIHYNVFAFVFHFELSLAFRDARRHILKQYRTFRLFHYQPALPNLPKKNKKTTKKLLHFHNAPHIGKKNNVFCLFTLFVVNAKARLHSRCVCRNQSAIT